MIHAPKIYANAGLVAIPITVDEDVAGVQFDLWYNPSTSYESIQFASGASGLTNEISAGHLKVAFSGPLNLSNPVCTITLNVTESTSIDISNAVGATEQAQSIDLVEDDGEVLIGEPMDVLVKWQANPPSDNITSYKVFQDGAEVGQAEPAPTEVTVTNIATGQGDIDFQVSAISIKGEGILSDPATVNTDLPAKVQGVTAEIV